MEHIIKCVHVCICGEVFHLCQDYNSDHWQHQYWNYEDDKNDVSVIVITFIYIYFYFKPINSFIIADDDSDDNDRQYFI